MAERRDNGEGSIYQEPDGRWRAVLTIRPGKVQKRRARTRAEASARLKAMRTELARGIAADRRLTVGALLDRWLAQVKVSGKRPRTWEAYEICVRVHLKPHIGHLRVADLAPSDVRDLYQTLASEPKRGDPDPDRVPLTAAYIAKVRSALRGALDLAVQDELVGRNVAALVRPPSVKKFRARPLTHAETLAVIAAMATHPHGPFWIFTLATGFRFGEAAGVKLADVDLDDMTVVVDEITARLPTDWRRQAGRGWELAETKTEASRRLQPLPAFGAAAVARQLELRAELKREAGDRWEEHGLLFTNRFGRPLRNDKLNERWHDLLKSIDLEGEGRQPVRLHDLRHTFGTLQRRMGTDLKAIQDLMGHASIVTTADVYVHGVPESLREAARRYDELLRPKPAGATAPAFTPSAPHTPSPPGRN